MNELGTEDGLVRVLYVDEEIHGLPRTPRDIEQLAYLNQRSRRPADQQCGVRGGQRALTLLLKGLMPIASREICTSFESRP